MEISTALESFHDFLFILFLVGLVVFVALYFVDAGYGKMRTENGDPLSITRWAGVSWRCLYSWLCYTFGRNRK